MRKERKRNFTQRTQKKFHAENTKITPKNAKLPPFNSSTLKLINF